MKTVAKPIRASYLRVFLTFARNSLVRNMTFRANFIIECISSICWMLMNFGFYVLLFQYAPSIGNTGWGQIRVLCVFGDHHLNQQSGRGLLHAQC